MQCLNLSNKEVKAAVDELTQVLGSEDAAYYIISENNGYAIDQAPNGAQSELFSALLSHFNGDRVQTIKAMAKTFTESFKMRLEGTQPSVEDVVGPVREKEAPKQKFSYQYHPAEEFITNYLDSIGEGSITSGELVSKLKDYLPKKSLARKLLDLFVNTDIEVRSKALGNNTVYMFYSAGKHMIGINTTIFGTTTMGYNAVSLMHEIVHAYTTRTLDRIKAGKTTEQEQKLYNTLVDLQKKYAEYYKSQKDVKGKFHGKYYGLNDIHEFAAELLTNEEFMSMLKQGMPKEHGFWAKLKQFVRYLAGLLHLTETDKLYDDLFDLVAYNVENEVTEQDFVETNSDLYRRQEAAVHNIEAALDGVKNDFDADTRSITTNILNSLQSRLKIYHNTDPVIEQQMKKSMEWQIANISQALVDEYTSIVNFLKEADGEIRTVTDTIIEAKRSNKQLSNEYLNDVNENFFDFYNDIVDSIVEKLGYRAEYRDIIGKDSEGHYRLDTLMNRAVRYQKALNEAKLLVKSQIALNAAQILNDVGVEVGAATIYRYNQSDAATYTKDISSFSAWMGAGDKIKDEAIKSIFYMINKADEKTRQQTYAKQAKLKALLDKVNKYRQLELFEVDDDGNTTGYFVRSRNYGKFEKAYKTEMDRICDELGIDKTDLNLPENRAIRIEYNKQRNKWLSEHCERRFTKEYYEAFNHLSTEAQAQREDIQVKIRNLVNKGRDEYGIFRPEKLNPDERNQLKRYQLEKKQLASIYDIQGRKKSGIQLQVAQELTELNQKLSKGLLYQKNSTAYEKEKARVMADKSLTQTQKDEWLELNSKEQFKEEFYQKLRNLAKKNYGEEYAALSDRRRAILAMFRDDATGEIDAVAMPGSTKRALSAISRQMTKIRKAKKNAQITEGEYEFAEIADTIPTKQWYIDKKANYDSIIADDPEKAENWLKENAYTVRILNADGTTTIRTVPKAWYTRMVPKDKSMIERVPNNNWLEVSKESPYYNDAYAQAQIDHPELKDEYWIPKKDKYDSADRYAKIMNDPNMKALYDALLETMAEANAAYSNLSHIKPYRAPQKSGTAYRYIQAQIRSQKGLNKLLAPFKGYGQYLVDKLSVRNDDVGFNKALTKPNGERLSLIPQNFIADLQRPEAINADVVGSVVAYYKAAMNWQNKKDIQPKIELLKAHVLGKKYTTGKGEVKSGESNVAKMVKKFVDMNLYDIKSQVVTIGIGKHKGSIFNLINYDIEGREINITKMLAILRKLGTTVNLALNTWCALTGMFTALHGHIVHTLVGRYYNPVDAAYALRDIIVDLLINVPNKIGLTTRQSQLSQKMEYFEVGARPWLNPTNRNNLANMAVKHWGFGIYSLGDHLVKGQILGSIMRNYKLVDGKFMSREEYKRTHNLDTFKPGDVLDWNFGDKLSFADATEIVAGELKAKDPANQKAVDAVKNEIGYFARQLSQSADGQLTDLQRSAIFANAFGQFVMMHRQYFPVILQERFTMAYQYDYQTRRYKEAMVQTISRVLCQAWNDDASFFSSIKQQYTNDVVVRENLKKIAAELMIWSSLAYILTPLLSSSADADRRNTLLQLLTYAIEKTTFEIMEPYNVKSMFGLLKNPSAILNYLDYMGATATIPVDIAIEQIKALFSDEVHQSNKRINRGPYRGMTKYQKNLIELTPAKNLIKLKDLKSQRDYYNRQIRGIEKQKHKRVKEEE